MTDETTAPETSQAPSAEAEPGPTSGRPESRQAEWLRQLQTMIDEVATQAGPVVRDVAAKAGELAQKAAEAAAPYAAKAADVTADVGQRVVDKSREVAADLRRSTPGGEAESSPEVMAPAAEPGDDEAGMGGAR